MRPTPITSRPGRQLAAGLLSLLALFLPAAAADLALEPVPMKTAPLTGYAPADIKFQGIPGLARAPGGRLWATWYAGGLDEGHENFVALVTSGDDGRTWSPITTVVDPPGLIRAFDPALWVDPSGRLWWFYTQSYKFWDGRAGVWAVTTDEPDSPSPKWSAPRRIADGLMMNKPTVLKNGDWLLPIARWSHQPPSNLPDDHLRQVPLANQHWDPAEIGSHVYRSRDQGRTFERLGTVHMPEVAYDEHMIVERKDGSLWMLARTKPGIAQSFSNDGGRTWSKPELSPIPHAHARFFIRRTNSGKLLLVKHNPRMDTPWLMGFRQVEGWQQRSHLTAYLSDDDGQTWYGGLVLDERLVVSYPDGQQAPDGRIFLVYDYNRKTDKEITLAVFTEEDVAAGRLVDPRSRLRGLIFKATGIHPNP
jgi:predicted neuraminidase